MYNLLFYSRCLKALRRLNMKVIVTGQNVFCPNLPFSRTPFYNDNQNTSASTLSPSRKSYKYRDPIHPFIPSSPTNTPSSLLCFRVHFILLSPACCFCQQNARAWSHVTPDHTRASRTPWRLGVTSSREIRLQRCYFLRRIKNNA